MALNGVNVLKEDVQVAQSNTNEIGNQGVLEQEYLDSNPDKGEVAT